MDQPTPKDKTNTLRQGVFAKFLLGYFGLPITFWLLGVLPAQGSNYLIASTTTPWLLLTLASLALIHACIIPIAVWNAASKYEGKKLWAILAKIMAVLSTIKWTITLPSYIAALLTLVRLV